MTDSKQRNSSNGQKFIGERAPHPKHREGSVKAVGLTNKAREKKLDRLRKRPVTPAQAMQELWEKSGGEKGHR